MYRTIIELKDGLTPEERQELRRRCIEVHRNKNGTVRIIDVSNNKFVFEGNETMESCLSSAFLTMGEQPDLYERFQAWLWEDEDPDENCNLLEISRKETERRKLLNIG